MEDFGMAEKMFFVKNVENDGNTNKNYEIPR